MDDIPALWVPVISLFTGIFTCCITTALTDYFDVFIFDFRRILIHRRNIDRCLNHISQAPTAPSQFATVKLAAFEFDT